MKKLKDILENAYYNGKLPMGCTPADVYTLCDVYNALCRKEKPGFIQYSVKSVLDRCGIKTVEKGIGWIAMR